jgi:hypothetical protein
VVVIVLPSIARENVAVSGWVVEAPVAPDAGTVAVTVGGLGGPPEPEGTTSIAAISGSSRAP